MRNRNKRRGYFQFDLCFGCYDTPNHAGVDGCLKCVQVPGDCLPLIIFTHFTLGRLITFTTPATPSGSRSVARTHKWLPPYDFCDWSLPLPHLLLNTTDPHPPSTISLPNSPPPCITSAPWFLRSPSPVLPSIQSGSVWWMGQHYSCPLLAWFSCSIPSPRPSVCLCRRLCCFKHTLQDCLILICTDGLLKYRNYVIRLKTLHFCIVNLFVHSSVLLF